MKKLITLHQTAIEQLGLIQIYEGGIKLALGNKYRDRKVSEKFNEPYNEIMKDNRNRVKFHKWKYNKIILQLQLLTSKEK